MRDLNYFFFFFANHSRTLASAFGVPAHEDLRTLRYSYNCMVGPTVLNHLARSLITPFFFSTPSPHNSSPIDPLPLISMIETRSIEGHIGGVYPDLDLVTTVFF